jgi:hypothetical protein
LDRYFWSFCIGEFYGGISFLSDPLQQNNTMNVPLSMLDGLFIHNFILPGLFLLIVIGIVPFLIAFGLTFRPVWVWTDALNRWTHRHWSWTAACLLSIILILWLGVEILIMRSGKLFPPQIATGALGFILFGLVWLPAVRKNYQK